MNEYETALLRFEKISRSHAEIKRQAQAIIDWANDEWDAAQANLRRYEKSPGIELPQYRRDLTAPMDPVTPWTLADATREAARIARDGRGPS